MRALIIVLLVCSLGVAAQEKPYARKVIKELSSSKYFGRGYSRNGLQKAEDYLVRELKRLQLTPMHDNSFLQEYSFAVNTFPGKMNLTLNGRKLKPGADFIVHPESVGLRAEGNLARKDSVHFYNESSKFKITLKNKLTWSVSTKESDQTEVIINKKTFTEQPHSFKVDIQNKFIENFKANNICALIRGKRRPDSLLLLTAHYDHLGGMGSKTYFPGANDNASGVSLLLNLAKYYSKNLPDYSIGFIFFSGEEAGLLGSKYFTENPLVDLSHVRFLINLDLTGTGDEGITVVNATEYKTEFTLLNQLNQQKNYLTKVNSRGKASSSDHYWFTKKGVPAFFIYTNGGIKAYHDIYDKASTLPLTEFDDFFLLLKDFNSRIMNEGSYKN